MSFYCSYAPDHPVHADYHNKEYGFPTRDERILFERLAMEIMQAGLSWEIVLKKRKGLNRAFNRFSVSKVSKYKARDIQRLLKDEGIIRNRLKIEAIIDNAQRLLEMRKTHKGFASWIAAHHPLSKAEWVKLFRQQFRFMGGEIVGEFLMSIGYLPGTHHNRCPIYKVLAKKRVPWLKATEDGFKYKSI
jgi:DNA-3-methyladenine glycosylase I